MWVGHTSAFLCTTMFSGAISALAGVYTSEGEGLERVRELLVEVQEMEETLGVAHFAAYFEAMHELKNLLVEEFNGVYEYARKQSIEVERMTIMVEEKNKAISTLADSNEDERRELKVLRERVKKLEKDLEEHEEKELKMRRVIAKLRKPSTSSMSDPPAGDMTPAGTMAASPFAPDKHT